MEQELESTLENIEKNLNVPKKFKDTILYNINYLLHNYYDHINYIILFGSLAKGTYKYTSDIDFLILSNVPISKSIKVDIRSDLTEIVERVSTDVVFYDIDTFKSSNKLIVNEMRKDGIVLWRKE